MTSIKSLLSACLVGLASAAVLPRWNEATRSSDNGFPKPNDAQKLEIAKAAGGLLPNGPLPTKLGPLSTTTLQLIAFNEQFEVAYFNTLYEKVKEGAAGFETRNTDKILKVLERVLNQEKIHALGARGILSNIGAFVPEPCKYVFPANNFKEALFIAETFTSTVLGGLQGASVNFATEGVLPLVQLIASVIGQEGEQNGFYRTLVNNVPSESPFLTPVPAPFAFSALQNFVVPGSCPFDLSQIPLPIFPTLTVNDRPVANIRPKDQYLTFSIDLEKSKAAEPFFGKTDTNLTMTFTHAQLLPITVGIYDVEWTGPGHKISFKANFPFEEFVLEGFTHGALTVGSGFKNLTETLKATIAAPALIQVADYLF